MFITGRAAATQIALTFNAAVVCRCILIAVGVHQSVRGEGLPVEMCLWLLPSRGSLFISLVCEHVAGSHAPIALLVVFKLLLDLSMFLNEH